MASKSKSRRRVLRASCLLAALIVAGSSFAWFTSKDEVTNRLSASSNYGVSIAENFQPPENWVPGQSINKDVGVVNTGNVDAFVRTWLTGEMKVLNTTALDESNVAKYDVNKATGYDLSTATATTDADLKKLNLTKFVKGTTKNTENYYYKELSTAQTTNPQENGENNQADGYDYKGSRGESTGNAWTPNSSAYSEVQSVQAGGYLVSAPVSAEYEYVTNQETELKIYLTNTSNDVVEQTVTVPGGTLVKVTKTETTSGTIGADGDVTLTATANAVRGTTPVSAVYVKAASSFTPVYVDAETFAPITAGTYIFARNVDQKKDDDKGVAMTYDSLDDYEFSGYYFDAIATDTTTAGNGHYWALKNADARGTNRSDYTLPKNYGTKINGTATDPASKLDTGYGEGYKKTVLDLDFDNSGNLKSVTPTANLELYTAAYKQIENGDLTWVYDNTNNVLSAIYQGGDDSKLDAADTDTMRTAKLRDDIVVDIKLANVVADNTNDSWFLASKGSGTQNYYAYGDIGSNGTYNSTSVPTAQAANRLWTFYYTNDVEEGDTTAKLVDSVTLRSTTQKDAFIAFDFDLNVNMESAQITFDEIGNERTTPVETTGIWADAASDTTKTGANATAQSSGEISEITWTAVTT